MQKIGEKKNEKKIKNWIRDIYANKCNIVEYDRPIFAVVTFISTTPLNNNVYLNTLKILYHLFIALPISPQLLGILQISKNTKLQSDLTFRISFPFKL